jgi:hypothetical protein
MDWTGGDHHVKWNKPDSERQIARFLSVWNLDLKTKEQKRHEGKKRDELGLEEDQWEKGRGQDSVCMIEAHSMKVWKCHSEMRVLPYSICKHFVDTRMWFSFVFGGSGLKASHLQSRCSTAWATPPVHFVPVILEICLGCPRTTILSQVTRIIGMSH